MSVPSLIMSRIYLPGKVNIAFRFALTCLQAKGGIILVIATVHYTRVYKEADTRGRNDRVFCTQFSSVLVHLALHVGRGVPRVYLQHANASLEGLKRRVVQCCGGAKAYLAHMHFFYFVISFVIICGSLTIAFGPRYSLFLYCRVITRNCPITAIKNLDIYT